MKKYLQSGWMRILSSIVCAISIVSLVIGVQGFIFVTAFRDGADVYESGYREVAENYALYAIDMLENGEEEQLKKDFEKKKINCSIQLVLNKVGENGGIVSTIEKEVTIGEVTADEKVELEAVAGSDFRYRENSLIGVLLGYSYYSDGTDWVEYPIEKVVFDPVGGLFYYKTALGFYPVDDIQVFVKGSSGYYDYRLKEENGKSYYYNGYYKFTLNTAQYQSWEWVNINGRTMYLASKGDWGNEIEVLAEGALDEEEIQNGEYYVFGEDEISTPAPELTDMYQVQISWTPEPHTTSLFTEWWNLSNTLNSFDTIAVPMIILSFVLMVVSFGLMVYSANSDKEAIGFMAKTPVACYSLAIFGVCFGIAAGVWELGNGLIHNDVGRLSDFITLGILVAFVMVWIVLGWFQNIVTRIKCRSFWRTTEVYYAYVLLKKGWKFASKPAKWCWGFVTTPFRAMGNGCKKVFQVIGRNVPLFWGGIGVFVVLSLLEYILAVNTWWNEGPYVILYGIFKIGEGAAVVWTLYQVHQLHEGSKRIALGDLTNPVDTSKMFWKFKEHGENINKVGDGIQRAVQERMKSEHFKTELITNVSHDIKTPLTSIINYVDLIKKEDVQDEKVQVYVDVLDRQSARLKKLIEDLMEASKASTGNLAVNLEECDIEVLLTQVIGEFEERLEKNQLEVVIDKPDHPVKMMADGRHMWRVLDNLLNNACKYSLPGSRVYVSLQQNASEAVITFKNISKTALNIPSEELMERFVRGDSSRNTEGSGLGLSIAQSLTELMRGNMKLEIDGDLFKVTLRFPIM